MSKSDKWAIPATKDLQMNTRVIVHGADGKKRKATVTGDPTRAEYPLILQDGSTMAAKRSFLELDPEGMAIKPGVLKDRKVFPLQSLQLTCPLALALNKCKWHRFRFNTNLKSVLVPVLCAPWGRQRVAVRENYCSR
eukprot:2660498-Rhodomonas_salina.3